jgi:hypothetical protein
MGSQSLEKMPGQKRYIGHAFPEGRHNDAKYIKPVVEVFPEFTLAHHFFKVPVVSEMQTTQSFMIGRTIKLPDLYLFPPGDAEFEDFEEG